MTYGYDALGYINSKSDTGSYTYGNGAHPHAVTSISSPAGGTYSYDADGNMTNRNGTTISWNSDNLPTSITESNSNASQFSYAPDKYRYYQAAEIAGVSETTVYAGAFEAMTTGGTTTYRYHLSADGREVAEVDLSNSGSTVNETVSYILSHHLGSVDVVQTINVATGALISTTDMSFSAWGGRREANTWLSPVSTSEAQSDHQADRYGFTHQEMLDNVALIHMNGRIYDPNLGRFLSVDPVFEFPTNSQSLNPYSYVLNNPLSMTGPTGYTATNCATDQTTCGETKATTEGSQPATTVHVSSTPTGSHIAVSGTLTATPLGNGSYAVTASNAGLAQAFSAGAQAMFGNGVQTSQGAADAQNKPAQHTDIGSPSQTGHFLNAQELQQFMKMSYSGTQGSDPDAETVYTTDVNGKVLIKTQANCEEAKCDLLNPPAGSAVGGHTHVYPEELRGLRIGQVPSVSQKAAMLARDMPGPGDTAFQGGPGELITPSNAHYSFEGTPQHTIMRYRGGGDVDWGKYVQKYWHQGMTDTDNYNLASQYLRGPPP